MEFTNAVRQGLESIGERIATGLALNGLNHSEAMYALSAAQAKVEKMSLKPSGIGCSTAVAGSESTFFPIDPGWPPHELPEHESQTSQVGQPYPDVRDSEAGC